MSDMREHHDKTTASINEEVMHLAIVRRPSLPVVLLTGFLLVLVATSAALAKTKLTIAVHFEAGQIEYLQEYVEEYQRLHPDIEIDLQSITFAEYLSKIQVMQAGGV